MTHQGRKTGLSPIGNPRSVFIHTWCSSTSLEYSAVQSRARPLWTRTGYTSLGTRGALLLGFPDIAAAANRKLPLHVLCNLTRRL
eukprot:3752404-Pyramimonas_sp.AAC.2